MTDWLRRALLSFCTIWMLIPVAQAQSEGTNTLGMDFLEDSIHISLLTCDPGNELYSMFGHSAIRVNNFTRKLDLTFNYGMFNYDSENFAFRFVMGHTDYELGAEYTRDFFYRYGIKRCEVREQKLHLTDEQQVRLLEMLFRNYQPENRVYRYNFLYDNCTVRARVLIENAISGNDSTCVLMYAEPLEDLTFREIIHGYTNGYPWVRFGVDMLLGLEVDRPLTIDESMFVPVSFEHMLDSALICCAGNDGVHIVTERHVVVPFAGVQIEKALLVTPGAVFWVLFLMTLFFAYMDLQRGKMLWQFDVVLMSIQGLTGIVLTFMMLFSEHPAVGSNLLVIFFNPLPFLLMPRMIKSKRLRKRDILTMAYLAWILAFLLFMPFSPQDINDDVYPFMATMLLRALTCEYITRWGPVKWLSLKGDNTYKYEEIKNNKNN